NQGNRDIITEECFRDQPMIEAFLKGSGLTLSDPRLVVVRLTATTETLEERAAHSGRPELTPEVARTQLDAPYFPIPNELLVATDGKSEEETLSATVNLLRDRICEY
ncbi:MAG: hypothetical protein JRN54_10180, partial [Nitrososphaerota archaeon]|nr:hypothetical protein [Nitrososphaerota archaeon]